MESNHKLSYLAFEEKKFKWHSFIWELNVVVDNDNIWKGKLLGFDKIALENACVKLRRRFYSHWNLVSKLISRWIIY